MAQDNNHSKLNPCFGAEHEYKALRDEILTRIRLRQNLIAITLTLGGVFLAVGLKIPVIAAVYPPLAAFLALAWAQNDFRIRDIAYYIRKELEPCLPACHWESYMCKNRNATKLNSWRFVVLAHGGVFMFTQIFTTLLAMAGIVDIWDTYSFLLRIFIGSLLILDVVSVLGVAWILKNSSK